MWRREQTDWPAIDEQVIGIIERPDQFDEVAWWTRTTDGWYVSECRGNLGHRDAATRSESRGPDLWCHAPKPGER